MHKKITSQHYRGFTIVELLIVIVIIAILATITLVSYNGIQQRARESRVVLQLTQLRKQMEMYKIENGEWPFQAEMNQLMTGNSHMTEASAWVNAARGYIADNGADSGAVPDKSGSGSIFSYTTNRSDGRWGACAGFSVTNSGIFSSSENTAYYISSAKLGVSPPYHYNNYNSGPSSTDDPGAFEWCQELNPDN